MIDNSIKKQILAEILKSKSFINSKLNRKLLTYLIECSVNNQTASEYSIASEVFNKDSGFNPNEDTIVRVSVYNLRKKLDRYYTNMGKKNKVRVKIPKGSYEVIFFNHTKEKAIVKLSNSSFWLSVLSILLLGIIIYLVYQLPSSKDLKLLTPKDSFTKIIFSELKNSSNPNLITPGDDFIYFSDFSEFHTTSERKMIRNSNINSEEEFEKYKSQDESKQNFKKLPFSFFNQAAVWSLPYVSEIFNKFGLEYTIKGTSSLTSNELKSHDIFFVGSFWTLGILEQVINELGITYNVIGEETLSFSNPISPDSLISFKRTGVPAFEHIDYSVFIKAPGPNNTTIFILASFYATGSVGAIKYLTNEKTLDQLKKSITNKFVEVPNNFLILFKSTGFNREMLSTELIKLIKIDSNMIEW